MLTLAMPLTFLVNGLMDDSFYYLQVARNVAAGLGSTFDGVEPTNGYHPLWLFVVTPLYAVFRGDEAPLRASLLIASCLGIGMLAWARWTLIRTIGAWGAVLGLLIFAWPRFFGQTLNLLETALLLFLYFWFIGAWVRRRQEPSRRSVLAQDVGWGVLLGLACLARLDTVFLLAALGVFALRSTSRGERFWPGLAPGQARVGRASLLWANMHPFGIALFVVAPYLVWNLLYFGHLQPVSGSMKTTFPRPGLTLRYLREFPEFTLLCLIGIAFLVIWLRRPGTALAGSNQEGLLPAPPDSMPETPLVAASDAAAATPTAPLLEVLAIFGLAGILHMTYTLVFMCWGVDRWHFGVLIPIGILGLPLAVETFLRRLSPSAARFARGALLAGGLAGAVLVTAYSLSLREGRYLDVTRHLAYWVRAQLPEDAVIATTDAGVMAYFSHRTTINLDGLINNYRYREYLRSGWLHAYLRERGVGYILDQYQAGVPQWVDGTYHTRPYRVWYRPERRLGGEIVLHREDEVARINTSSRLALGSSERLPNAVVLWRYRGENGAP